MARQTNNIEKRRKRRNAFLPNRLGEITFKLTKKEIKELLDFTLEPVEKLPPILSDTDIDDLIKSLKEPELEVLSDSEMEETLNSLGFLKMLD